MKTPREQEIRESATEAGRGAFRQTAQTFAQWLAQRLNRRARAVVTTTPPSSQIRKFARRMIQRQCVLRGADPLAFISQHFGKKFTATTTPHSADEKVYRLPDRRNATYNSLTELFMSFRFNQYVQNLNLLIEQFRIGQNVDRTEYAKLESQNTRTLIEQRELLRALESHFTNSTRQSVQLSLLTVRETNNSSERRSLDRLGTGILDRTLSLINTARGGWRQTSVHTPQTTTLKQTTQANAVNLVNRSFLKIAPAYFTAGKSLFSESHLRPDSVLTHRTFVRKGRTADASGQRPESVTATGQSPHSAQSPQRNSIPLPFPLTKRFDLGTARNFKTEFRAIAASENSGSSSTLRTLISEMTAVTASRTQWSMPVQRFALPTSTAAVFAHQSPITREVTAFVKNQPLAAPSPQFVFAQPTRQAINEAPQVSQIETRAVVELVKKEVQRTMARESPLVSLTREDYAEISDQVYATLARRLTVERERLGLP